MLTEQDLHTYSAAFAQNGFFGPCSYYMNLNANRAYATRVVHDGHLDMPVLFLHGQFDLTCETIHSGLAEPMRAYCRNLTEKVISSGHWMPQEQPQKVNATIREWLADSLVDH